ncbi:hypothetical protein DRF60_15060 [Chryseobacterium elymi]|uniref:HNH nuclease domain-containing protein n=1 Tax=Chryseobacterium elymi TaxID=395936 RepID=A0A3D9DCZ4_9FLAO|nr:HNH endonuclease [Chryseobacterium elymi]REC75828.1 hypothetical protein DRF60_15060 [Chryseobacterium elymi]
MTRDYWIFKTVAEVDRSFQTIDSYEDSISEYYNYDSLVPNSKQIKKNDIAIITDKKKILGFASIAYIDISKGEKIIRRCPQCPSTTIDSRKTKFPKYRCNKGHAFDIPLEEPKVVTKFKAVFNTFLPFKGQREDLLQIRPFYTKGYNQNMSMQRLDSKVFKLFGDIEQKLQLDSYNNILSPEQGYVKEEQSPYTVKMKDEREIILQAIKLRRGQQSFRKKLLEKYNRTCIITGCNVVDILEAAHIKPYRGENDHHPNNGLLLRADIHTLFDLNLISINPSTFEVIVSDLLINSEYIKYNKQKLSSTVIESLSGDALKFKWKTFLKNMNNE